MKLVERYGVRDNKLILTVGRIASQERYKGFDEVIEAMPELLRRFPNLKYMIVGDGDDRNRLEEKVKSLGVSEQIIFTGRISEHEKVSHYCIAVMRPAELRQGLVSCFSKLLHAVFRWSVATAELTDSKLLHLIASGARTEDELQMKVIPPIPPKD